MCAYISLKAWVFGQLCKSSKLISGNAAIKIVENNGTDVNESKQSEDTEENEVEIDGVQKIVETMETEQERVLDNSAINESQGESKLMISKNCPIS